MRLKAYTYWINANRYKTGSIGLNARGMNADSYGEVSGLSRRPHRGDSLWAMIFGYLLLICLLIEITALGEFFDLNEGKD